MLTLKMSIVNSFLHLLKNISNGAINHYFMQKFTYHHEAETTTQVCQILQKSSNQNNYKAVSTFEMVKFVSPDFLDPSEVLTYLIDLLFEDQLKLVNHQRRLKTNWDQINKIDLN